MIHCLLRRLTAWDRPAIPLARDIFKLPDYRPFHAGGSTHGIECSMSRRANCWDNAVVESFFATLKTELIHHADYQSPAEARAAIFEFIEVFYNRQRRHSTLGYHTPAGFERMARAA